MAASATPQHASTSPLGRRFGDAIAAAAFESLTPGIVRKAKLCLLDYLSCALASHELPWSREAIAVAADPAASRGCTIVGTASRARAHDAAFANGVLGHALVRDDMHLGSVSHLGVVVLPVALALAERSPTSGAALLTAIACGYEVGGRIGRAILDVDVAKRFRPTGIAGPVGAAAAAAKLLGLEAAGIADAIAIAANAVGGYNEWAATGGSEMFFQVGFAARNGLASAELAAAGAYASPSALDGPAGLLAAFGKRDAAIGAPFVGGAELESVFFKPVPACNFAQTPAQAAQRLTQETGLDPAAIDRVVVRVTRAAAAYPGCGASGPFEHVLQAKMSIPYNVAVALTKCAFDEPSYRPAEQSEIARLAKRVLLEIDAELSAAYPGRQGAEVAVMMRDGTLLTQRLDDVVAASEDEVVNRFATAGERRLGAAQTRRLFDTIMSLESEPDAGRIARLTSVAA
jgi:2-methylcitrate dehydratase PrpD